MVWFHCGIAIFKNTLIHTLLINVCREVYLISLVFSTIPCNATNMNKEKSLSQYTLPSIMKTPITNGPKNFPMDEFPERFLFHSAYSAPSKPFSSSTLQNCPIPHRHASASFQTPLQFNWWIYWCFQESSTSAVLQREPLNTYRLRLFNFSLDILD